MTGDIECCLGLEQGVHDCSYPKSGLAPGVSTRIPELILVLGPSQGVLDLFLVGIDTVRTGRLLYTRQFGVFLLPCQVVVKSLDRLTVLHMLILVD